MRVAIVTNFNGRGLERDAEILEDLLARAGHESERVPWTVRTERRFDLAIFLEVAPRWAAGLAPRRWLIPNPEWWDHPGHGEWLALDSFERVLCKTAEARRLFGACTDRAEYVGFTARDRYLSTVPRERRFLAVAGVSVAKGVDAVVRAWDLFTIPYRLTVVGKLFASYMPRPNIEYVGHLDDGALRVLQNACLFHLQPSWTEGFGVTLHEALSCGAVLATTAAPPMNEVPASAYISPSGLRRMCLATAHRCRPQEVHVAVEALWSMGTADLCIASECSRDYYVHRRLEFEDRFLALLA